MYRLAVICTHPIQYYAPIFKKLTNRSKIELQVFYEWDGRGYDQGFGQSVEWDIPLLDGYGYSFIENKSKNPGTHHFRGLINPSLIQDVEKWDPDAILIFGWNFQSHLKTMYYFSGRVPVFFRGDSTLLDEQKGVRTVARRLFLRCIYSFIDAAFYVGTNNKAYFKKHGLTEEQLFWAPHAIDNERFGNGNNEFLKQADNWKDDLGIASKDKVILYAGKLEPKKNPLLLLKAFKKLATDLNIHLIYAGSGKLETKLRQRAKSTHNVHFIGFQNQTKMPIVYRLSNLFVLPSKGPGETWGLAVNEAMASGVPSVVSDKVGCGPDLIEEGKTGFIFRSGDVDDLVIKLRQGLKLKSKPESQLTMEKKLNTYSFDTVVRNIEKAVNQYFF